MYSIKIMSGENKADSDVGKGFKMIMVEAGDTFEFDHDKETGLPQVTVTSERNGEPRFTTYPVTGNCYVLSETGKTVASFWGRSLWGSGNNLKEIAPETDQVVRSLEDQITTSVFKGPFHDNCTAMRQAAQSRGLTNRQIMLLQEKPLARQASEPEREKAFRSRVSYLMANGIPSDIAFENASYLK